MNFSDIEIGMELPPMIHDVEILNTAMYCAVTWDFARQHYDQAYAAALGFRAPVIDPQMYGAYLARFVTDWASPDARLKGLKLQYRKPGYVGDKLTYTGRVADKYAKNAQDLVDCELLVHNADLETLVKGIAVLAFVGNDADRIQA